MSSGLQQQTTGRVGHVTPTYIIPPLVRYWIPPHTNPRTYLLHLTSPYYTPHHTGRAEISHHQNSLCFNNLQPYHTLTHHHRVCRFKAESTDDERIIYGVFHRTPQMGAADGARESNWRCRTASHLPSFLFWLLTLVWLWNLAMDSQITWEWRNGDWDGLGLGWTGLDWILSIPGTHAGTGTQ